MDTGILDLAAYSRAQMQLDIHELMDPKLRKPVTGCNLNFPHSCKVHDGKMVGSWERRAGVVEQSASPLPHGTRE
jgi:hypothetical protein